MTKFISGLAAQLLPEGSYGGDSIDAENAFRASLAALPKGKLKRALAEDEPGNVERLVAELEALKSKGAITEAAESTRVPTGAVAQGDDSLQKSGFDTGSTPELIPCTVELYAGARALAVERADGGNPGLLLSLAANPRAPVDLLVEAAETRELDKDEASPSRTRLGSVVSSVRNLTRVMIADPSAATTSLLTNRLSTLVSAVAEVASTKTDVERNGDGAGIGELDAAVAFSETLGLVLRALQVASLACPPHQNSVLNHAQSTVVDPADRLLLQCMPRAPTSAALGALGSASTAGTSTSPLAAHRSASRLLAHYAVAMAACSVGWEGGATDILKRVRCVATVATLGYPGGGRSNGNGRSNSSDDDDESDESDGDDGGGEAAAGEPGDDALSHHLLTLCAGHLAGEESATLNFLRCVGDACFLPREGEPSQPLLPPSAATRLAATCVRALARLPRPNASPDLSAVLFLKRAYAARVVQALGRGFSPVGSGVYRGGSADVGRQWDFVGSSSVPRGLTDFLRRPEAPAAIGSRGEAAGAVFRTLASRQDSPASVVEALRSAEECAPAALGSFLSAVEMLSAGEEADGSRDKVDPGGSDVAVAGGFFLDAGGGGAGVGGAGSVVLAPLGSGSSGQTGVIEMDEEEDGDEGRVGLNEDGDGLADG
ncbi:unnamed protein product [Ascophyllum nodosum]